MTGKKRNLRGGGAGPGGSKKKARRPSGGANEECSKQRTVRQLLQRASRRPRSTKAGADGISGGRLFVTALARGLDVLGAFRSGDRSLGNPELAERTGLPKPTISRITIR